MTKSAVLLISGLLVSVICFPQRSVKDCKGFFRWDVKTLTDDAGPGLLSSVIHDSALTELVSGHPPEHLCILSKRDGRLPRYDDETQLVRIIATIVSVKTEKDQDLHIVLKSVNCEDMMIGEIPDPDCRIFDSLPSLRTIYREARIQLHQATDQVSTQDKPVMVEITGVLFWDARHWWQHGCARNGREIHPVISVKLLSR